MVIQPLTVSTMGYAMGASATQKLLILLLALNVLSTICSPEAEYQIFKGFNLEDWTTTIDPSITTEAIKNSTETEHGITTNETAVTTPFALLTARQWSHSPLSTTIITSKKVSMVCPEAETPSNIGPYEVPTQRDLVLHTMNTLHRLFASYHQKSMLFLDDVQKVVTATDKVANKCRGDKVPYKKCVKDISNKCESITKSLVMTLEQQRQDILQFGKGTICSLNAMKEDPVKLIKILASEEASLEFALPGFLRLLSSCNSLCISPTSKRTTIKTTKPSRHLTDTDLVIRHFLTKKNYKRLLPEKMYGNGIFKIPVPSVNKRNP